MWRDRVEAGGQLGDVLVRSGLGGRGDVIVLGVPRGGVEVAREVADRLECRLDVVVVRKIGAPGNREYAVGAVDLDGRIYASSDAGVRDEYLRQAARQEQAEAFRRLAVYRAGLPDLELVGLTAIVVDDGIATGLTAAAALSWLRGRGAARTVLAAPVMSPDAVQRLRSDADEVVALSSPAGFAAVGEYYGRFPQLTDADVVRLLRR